MSDQLSFAHFGDRLALDLVDVTHDLTALDSRGWWAVVMTYEGTFTAARFDDVRQGALPRAEWPGISRQAWTSSMARPEYLAAVETVRAGIARGDVYQANICRVLQAERPSKVSLAGLADILTSRHPAPHAGTVVLPSHGMEVVSASPELFLRRARGTITSSPIKGTAKSAEDLLDKDSAENVMIVDLVRNDLGIVCQPGSITVPTLLEVQSHPGLVHLVSTVQGTLRPECDWQDLLDATFPPGSVTGAPKSSARRVIDQLEPVARGPYCGAVGWVDADRRVAELAVGIRTFWADADWIYFGTGAGITWGSDAVQEWEETELKADRLLQVAAERTTR